MRRWLLACCFLASTNAFAQQADDSEAPPMSHKADSKAKKSPKPTAPPPSAEDDSEPPAPKSVPKKVERSRDVEERGNLNLTDKPVADEKYGGVAPGAPALPPHPPRLPLKGPQRMTWPGFQVKEGVPTVFLEVTAAPDYQVEDAPGALTVTLKNTTVPLKNNRRPLDVRAFATAVQEVATTSKGRDVRVTIKTKGVDKPVHHERIEDGAGGFRILVIELPAAK
ncbi:MAG TPA: AMIN domain-containing protein [Polyangia bacterium]|jgi:hypothetical protein|nr:AMIN domain-containing protein [Polyangia bacterium]HWE27557.1 AMIN domain-containing protein [Polyangia bacterium]